MAKKGKMSDMNLPIWFDGQNITEALFCEEFLHERRIIFANGAFFTPDGRVTDDLPLRGEIYEKLKNCAVNNAKAHSKDRKTRYYYYCKNTVTPTGHECTFRTNIEQTEINKMVAKIISAMVNKPRFAEAIKAKIGTAVDTEDMERQVAVLQGQLKQVYGMKNRLERQMDTLDINDAHYDRRILDLQRRYDEQYDTIGEIEVQLEDLQSQICSIQQEKISGDNIYRLLLAFDEVYNSATEAEQKEFMKAFIEKIDLFPQKRDDGCWIRNIVFNFPVPLDGGEVKEMPLESETTVESIVLLSKPIVD